MSEMKAIVPILAGASAALLAPLGPLLTAQPVYAQAKAESALVQADLAEADLADCTLRIQADGDRLDIDAGEGCSGTAAVSLSGRYRARADGGTM